MFELRKAVLPFFLPFLSILCPLLLGSLLLWKPAFRRMGTIMVSTATLLLYLASTPFVANLLIEPLEQHFAPLLPKEQIVASDGTHYKPEQVKWIVVLGGGHVPNEALSPASRLSRPALVRVVESISLLSSFPNAALLLSGGGARYTIPETESMKALALSLAVAADRIVVESSSRTTADQALNVKAIVKNDPLLLVTEASHMPRSILLFESVGLHPIAAPTGFLLREPLGLSWRIFQPDIYHLAQSERAIYEYLGMVWGWVNGSIE